MLQPALQSSAPFPVELKRNGFQQINWRLTAYGLLGYAVLVAFVTYFAAQPLPQISVPDLYVTPKGATVTPPVVGVQFPPELLRPDAQASTPGISNQRSSGNISGSVTPTSTGGVTGPRVRHRRGPSSTKGLDIAQSAHAGPSWAELTASTSGVGSPAVASGMSSGDLEEKLDRVERIQRFGNGGTGQGITTETEPGGPGFQRAENSMAGVSKNANVNLGRFGLNSSGPDKITASNGNLSGDVVIDKSSFSVQDSESLKGRGQGELMTVVNTNMPMLRSLYQQALKLNPGLEGVLKIRLTIEGNGRVSNVEVLADSLSNNVLSRRIKSVMRSWRFGAVDTGQTKVVLTFPFTSNG